MYHSPSITVLPKMLLAQGSYTKTMIFFFSVHVCVHYIFTGACVQARQCQQVFFRSCTHVHIHLQYMGGCVLVCAHRNQKTTYRSRFSPSPSHMCPRNQTQGARLSDEHYQLGHLTHTLLSEMASHW